MLYSTECIIIYSV